MPHGFSIQLIAHVPRARELAALPNGDLLVGTSGTSVMIVPDAEGDAGTPAVFATLPERLAAGVAYANGTIAIGTMTGVYRLGYTSGERTARGEPAKIASVRTGGNGGHSTTSVAIAHDGTIYASVGSSCNACVETDPTRATIHRITGSGMTLKAKRIRNAIALGVDPRGHVWLGNAGQDSLPSGHPYEIVDDVDAAPSLADYGWPDCEENHVASTPGTNCSGQTVPHAVLPAYNTPIGLTFYAPPANAKYAFPAQYRGGLFVAAHGSWHTPHVAPRVAFFPMHNGAPEHAVNWSDPNAQWTEFLGGLMDADGTFIARPTGITVGPSGSLFVADDANGAIYRIRPVKN